jgi:CHAT domain-containing protein
MNIRHTSRHQWFMPSRISRRVLLILVSIALLVAGWSFRSFYLRKSAVTTGLKALVAAYEGRRPLQARITGLAYAPFLSRRGESDDFDPVNRDLAERLLLEAVAEKPTSSARQALGQFYLMSGSPAKAVVQFEEALKEDAGNASLRNDFGVALMELSHTSTVIESENTLLYSAKALEEFEAAVKLNPANVEALFNRALLLDQMKLPQQRDQAWQAYLARETDHNWTTEAKRTIQNLSEQNSARLPRAQVLESFLAATLAADDERSWRELTRNKDMIAETFIPQELAYAFLSASLNKNEAEAGRLTTALRYAGKLELEKAGDPFVSELAAFYSRTSIEQQTLLHQAHVLLRNGYAASMKAIYEYAPFEESRKLFLRAGDVWEAKICDYWIAYSLSQKTELKKSTDLLTALAKFSKARRYQWLEAQAICWIANNHTKLREYSKSIDTYKEALSIATKINDVYNQQKILSQSGNNYMRLGQPERALQYDWRALQLIDPVSNSARQTWRTYLYTTRVLAALGLFEAAAQYGAAMLDLAANDLHDPATLHFSDLYVAQINGGRKNFAEAIRLASESLSLADSIQDPKNAIELRTGSLLLLAHLQRQSGALQPALDSYNQAINNYNQMEPSIYRYDALKGRLLCYVALKDNASFEAQLPDVLAEYEKHRANIFEEQNQNTFFDREQGVYDLAISHELEKHDDLGALNYSEQSRARSLLKALTEKKSNSIDTASAAPLPPAELQRQLPANLQVLQYAVLEDKLVIWLITSTKIESKTKDIRADELRTIVTEYVKGISSGPGKADKLRSVSQRLYETLIGPFREALDPQRVLCIIPDKALSYVPFDALISPASQRYLISEFSLLSSPSLNVLVSCTSTAKTHLATTPETLLSIGNPTFDRQQYPDLEDLPAAAREASGITSNYSKSYPLIGKDAVKQAIEKQLPAANVIHFAGHYVIDQAQPLLSKLVLASQPGSKDSTDLTVGEIFDMKLPRTKLVVLSACETSGKDYFNGEGLIGIARTFLRTGIPLVIASQWSVESESTAQLMLRFHHYRKLPGVSSLAALRKAQLELLEDPNGLYRDPYYWAAFTTVGGYADF